MCFSCCSYIYTLCIIFEGDSDLRFICAPLHKHICFIHLQTSVNYYTEEIVASYIQSIKCPVLVVMWVKHINIYRVIVNDKWHDIAIAAYTVHKFRLFIKPETCWHTWLLESAFIQGVSVNICGRLPAGY